MNLLVMCSILLCVKAIQNNKTDICAGTPCEDCLVAENECENCHLKKLAIECSGNGDLVCGECKCNNGYSGKACEVHEIVKRSTEMCILPNSSHICSGRGECISGQCACSVISSRGPQRYTGRYCECDDYSCRYYNGQLCGGPERGFCDCGVCNCKPGYSGYGCSCIESDEPCISTNGKVCNGYGICACGRCKCNKESKMMGPTCEDCLYCDTSCEKALPCVSCLIKDEGGCVVKCDEFKYSFVDGIDTSMYKCSFKGEEDCVYEFGLSSDTSERLKISVKSNSSTGNGGISVAPLQSMVIYGQVVILMIINYCLSNLNTLFMNYY